MNTKKAACGAYYTVLISVSESLQIPYKVFAKSDYHAARIVKDNTGHLAKWYDVGSH